jgi:hypothetical protein
MEAREVPLAIRRLKRPTDWIEVKAGDGMVIGQYGIQDGMITVRHPDGWEKTTTVSAAGDNKGLARLILSEPPPGQGSQQH